MNQNENHTPHTPLPWNVPNNEPWTILATNNLRVADFYAESDTLLEESKINAAFIVKCVNEHALLEAVAEAAGQMYGHSAKKRGHDFECICPGDALRNALAALATHRKGGEE